MTTSTTVTNLKVNKLTKAQYLGIAPGSNEFYCTIDDAGITAADISNALGYTPGTVTSVNNVSPVSGNVTLNVLPSQTGHSGEYLTTDGTSTSWGTPTASVASDNKSITKNSSNEIQTVGVIDQNNTSSAIKTWTGTRAQYDAIVTKDATTLYTITDDTDATLSVIEALYPVGSVYLTFNNVCPLQTLGIGSWVLESTGVVTSVNTNVPVKFNNTTVDSGSVSSIYFYHSDGTVNTGGNKHNLIVNTDGKFCINPSNVSVSSPEDVLVSSYGTVTASTSTINIFRRSA